MPDSGRRPRTLRPRRQNVDYSQGGVARTPAWLKAKTKPRTQQARTGESVRGRGRPRKQNAKGRVSAKSDPSIEQENVGNRQAGTENAKNTEQGLESVTDLYKNLNLRDPNFGQAACQTPQRQDRDPQTESPEQQQGQDAELPLSPVADDRRECGFKRAATPESPGLNPRKVSRVTATPINEESLMDGEEHAPLHQENEKKDKSTNGTLDLARQLQKDKQMTESALREGRVSTWVDAMDGGDLPQSSPDRGVPNVGQRSSEDVPENDLQNCKGDSNFLKAYRAKKYDYMKEMYDLKSVQQAAAEKAVDSMREAMLLWRSEAEKQALYAQEMGKSLEETKASLARTEAQVCDLQAQLHEAQAQKPHESREREDVGIQVRLQPTPFKQPGQPNKLARDIFAYTCSHSDAVDVDGKEREDSFTFPIANRTFPEGGNTARKDGVPTRSMSSLLTKLGALGFQQEFRQDKVIITHMASAFKFQLSSRANSELNGNEGRTNYVPLALGGLKDTLPDILQEELLLSQDEEDNFVYLLEWVLKR